MSNTYNRFIYWIPTNKIEEVKNSLNQKGYKFKAPLGSQCEVLKTSDKTLGYGEPGLFNRVCKRQGSWYRASNKNGKHLIVSDHELMND